MIDFHTGVQQIVDGQGVPIAVAGMTIVFSALSFIATFIAVLPRALRLVARVVPEPPQAAPRRAAADDGAALAAAAAAFHAAHAGKP
jgi:Na+-transporting methylmalonyl-CoA/oxaloacetate decarboxylase gamma subunit